jgi:hypothetical protein
MAINFDNYRNRSELIKYLAFFPITRDRYTRLNEYYETLGTLGLKAYENPVGSPQLYYGSLEFASSTEPYIDYLERINLIQPESQLLSLTSELEDTIQEVFLRGHLGKCDIEMTSVLDYPFIISGNLDEIAANDIGGIIDPMGAYFPVLNIIIIDQVKVTEISNNLKWTNQNITWPNYSAVYEITLRHEVSHWISHEMLVKGESFRDTSFIGLPPEIHEFGAQLFAYNLLDNDTETQKFMDLLADSQPAIYQLYKEYSGDLSYHDLRDLLIRRNEITNINNLRATISDIKGWVI